MSTPLSRIEKEFVLKSLAESNTELELRWARGQTGARMVEATEREVVLRIPEDAGLPSHGDRLEVYFEFQNNKHTFSERVASVQDRDITVPWPDGLFKHLQRHYERVERPEGISVVFSLGQDDEMQISFPTVARSDVAREDLDVSTDASIKSLVAQFNKSMGSRVSENEMVMMRNRQPRSAEERLMQGTGKAVWLPDTGDDYPTGETLGGRVLSKTEMVEFDRDSGTEAFLIVSRLASRVYEKREAGITSELHWPMVYGELFVGYIHLVTRGEQPRIDVALLEWTAQFSALVCHALARHGYFSASAAIRTLEGEVVDLSASGVLFSHANKDLHKKLLLNSDLDLQIVVGARRIAVGSRIVRKLMDGEQVYVALKFLDIAPEDFRFLYETLYRRPLQDLPDPKDIEEKDLDLDI